MFAGGAWVPVCIVRQQQLGAWWRRAGGAQNAEGHTSSYGPKQKGVHRVGGVATMGVGCYLLAHRGGHAPEGVVGLVVLLFSGGLLGRGGEVYAGVASLPVFISQLV